ncbi:uncharacterized protein LOC106644380 [Copidosoma floridanum]|uniref:uncharacterized protein LOC106644380 n=1 Tax=Copidosoma floridanum TaxID=29053 RepID=UPI0006C9DB97|nr:uncharacterized protein LOC106644380 [Copidosoma floridanum]
MAPYHSYVLVLLVATLLARDIRGNDTTPASYPNDHPSHLHRAPPHHHGHHRYPNSPSWTSSGRHNAHGVQYPHGRHNHESSLRRDPLIGFRNLVRYSSTTPAALTIPPSRFSFPPLPGSTTTTRSTTPASTTSRNGVRPLGYQRSSALALEPSASRSVAYSSVVRPDAQHVRPQQQNLGPIYPNVVTTTTSVYSKYHPGRRVCSTTSSLAHHRSRQARLVYADLPSGFLCCPGWMQVTRLSFGCNKPVCSLPCQNGGVCSAPGKCTCPKGYSGIYCQTDVDECVTEKPCDQTCRNVPGSYECYCRSGFELQPDRHSCRKNDSDGTALEARDLEEDFEEETTTTTTKRPILRDTENEVAEEVEESSYEELLRRLVKLEKQFAKGKKKEMDTSEITARIASAIDSVNEIRRSIQNMQAMQQELYDLRNKIKLYEFETRKIQHLSNRVIDLENRLRLRCRTGIYGSTYIS